MTHHHSVLISKAWLERLDPSAGCNHQFLPLHNCNAVSVCNRQDVRNLEYRLLTCSHLAQYPSGIRFLKLCCCPRKPHGWGIHIEKCLPNTS
jgi:hypothetical protein